MTSTAAVDRTTTPESPEDEPPLQEPTPSPPETSGPAVDPGRSIGGGFWAPVVRHLGLFTAGCCALFVFLLLNWPDPDAKSGLTPLLFLDTTPSGGDMGAHVWGPAFLRDHLLPLFRLSGWTPDWYAGFPAYHYYMVIPSLAIVVLNAGLPLVLGIPAALAVVAATVYRFRRSTTARPWIVVAGVILSLLVVSLPYGVAFKLVTVSGLLGFPFAAWAMARLAKAPEPVPTFVALAAFVFLFDTNFNIYGGNIASTLAGEFAFSLSLCLALLVIGVAVGGMDDDRWRASAAVLLGLVALCHVIPVFFVIPAVGLTVLTHREVPRAWALAATVALALVPMSFAEGRSIWAQLLAVGAVAVVLAAANAAEAEVRRRTLWLLLVGPVSIMLASFWLLPFYVRDEYFNDMGWERLNEVGGPLLTVPIKIALPVAAVGVLLSYAHRERIGMIFTATAAVFASAVANLGEGALWNARLLPFYYLSVYIVAAVGVALVLRHVSVLVTNNLERPSGGTMVAGSLAALLAILIAVAMPLRAMPGGHTDGQGRYHWLAFTNSARSFLPTWISWNYSGYEYKEAYREYASVVGEMDRLGRENVGSSGDGCGRAMWEYDKELDRYGTPMALMLLPFWTDGCIGSMEGLYFESSATTPFHFLNQSMLSDAPSRAQRDLPYQQFDITRGVEELKIMGVRYYMAQSDAAIAAAETDPDLVRVGEAQPFVIFEVANTVLVEPLSVEPVVVSGPTADQVAGTDGGEADKFEVGWLSQAVEYYNHPDTYAAMPAEDGPESWARHQTLAPDDGRPVDPTEISDISVGTADISFTASRLGTPVLVKASYFPNWKVEGADGPYRVGPNLMVVVPTDTQVRLHYGRTGVDLLATALTLAGVAAVAGMALIARRRRELAGERWVGAEDRGWDDESLPFVVNRPMGYDDEPSRDPEYGDGRGPVDDTPDEPIGAAVVDRSRSAATPGYSPDLQVADFYPDGVPDPGADTAPDRLDQVGDTARDRIDETGEAVETGPGGVDEEPPVRTLAQPPEIRTGPVDGDPDRGR